MTRWIGQVSRTRVEQDRKGHGRMELGAPWMHRFCQIPKSVMKKAYTYYTHYSL